MTVDSAVVPPLASSEALPAANHLVGKKWLKLLDFCGFWRFRAIMSSFVYAGWSNWSDGWVGLTDFGCSTFYQVLLVRLAEMAEQMGEQRSNPNRRMSLRQLDRALYFLRNENTRDGD